MTEWARVIVIPDSIGNPVFSFAVPAA